MKGIYVMEKIFTLSGLELESAPSLSISIPAGTVQVLNHRVSDLQEALKITGTNHRINGTVLFNEKFTEYSNDALKQFGNFMCIKAEAQNAPAGATIEATINGETRQADENGYIVIRLTVTGTLTVALKYNGKTIVSNNYPVYVSLEYALQDYVTPYPMNELPGGKVAGDLQHDVTVDDFTGQITGTVVQQESYPEITQNAPCYVAVLHIEVGGAETLTVEYNGMPLSPFNGEYIFEYTGQGTIVINATRRRETFTRTRVLNLTEEQPSGGDNIIDVDFEPYQTFYSNKAVAEVQKDIVIEYQDKYTPIFKGGSLFSIPSWPDFDGSGSWSEVDGHYLVFHVNDTSGAEITAEVGTLNDMGEIESYYQTTADANNLIGLYIMSGKEVGAVIKIGQDIEIKLDSLGALELA